MRNLTRILHCEIPDMQYVENLTRITETTKGHLWKVKLIFDCGFDKEESSQFMKAVSKNCPLLELTSVQDACLVLEFALFEASEGITRAKKTCSVPFL